MSAAFRPDEPSEDLIREIVHAFYGEIRRDEILGPIFEGRLAGRWDAHLGKMVDFWSSVVLRSGWYEGKPHLAHQGLGLEPSHFERWLTLFCATVEAHCTGAASAIFLDRAHRIADSLQIGLNIGPKALRLPARVA